jgi:hypothetical protein
MIDDQIGVIEIPDGDLVRANVSGRGGEEKTEHAKTEHETRLHCEAVVFGHTFLLMRYEVFLISYS